MKSKIVYIGCLLLLVSSVVVFSCGKSGGYGGGGSNNNNYNPPPATNEVSIVNMSFSSASLIVTAGTTVTWTNNDDMDHTVTANDNSFDSGHIPKGTKYSRKFASAGTYAYHCSLHANMNGTVVVKAY